jgi:Ca2+-binding EF-hand superfamily protein
MLLKGKDVNVEIEIKVRKAQLFEESVCNENENLLAVLPQKAMGRNNIGFLIDLISFFQVGENKLPKISEEVDEDGNKKYDLYDFLDDYLEVNKKMSITELYAKIIEEFDVKGIIDRGLGFQMAKMLRDAVEQMKTEMTLNKATATQQQNVENG